MASNLVRTFARNVRSLSAVNYRPPYPKYMKSGHRENGPFYLQEWDWPAKSSGWNLIPPSFPDLPDRVYSDDSLSQRVGYPDSVTGQYVTVPAAQPEIIVPPDLDSCTLKPYVTFRCQEMESDAPPLTARDLFEIFYADTIEADFKQGKYSDGTESLLEVPREQRRQALTEKGLPVLDDGEDNGLKRINS